jgi:hypothetical protein
VVAYGYTVVALFLPDIATSGFRNTVEVLYTDQCGWPHEAKHTANLNHN